MGAYRKSEIEFLEFRILLYFDLKKFCTINRERK